MEFSRRAKCGVRADAARLGRHRGPKFVHVDARLSQTAANADEFVACKPGTEGLLALAIAALVDKTTADAAEYAPAKVSEKTGVAVRPSSASRASSRPMDRPSRSSAARRWRTPTDRFTRTPLTRLNRAARTVNQPGGVSFIQQAAPVSMRPLKEIIDAAPKVLLLDDVNPVFTDRRPPGKCGRVEAEFRSS